MEIVACEPDAPLAAELIAELSAALRDITGADGRASFVGWEPGPRATFVVALDEGTPVGCGGLRQLDERTAEIKRMYARRRGLGIGGRILAQLESFAREAGYERVVLETRAVNQGACRFYLENGYRRIANYGRYAGRPECVCFEKVLDTGEA